MVKVTNPLHSQIATGNFAKALQFICGTFVREIPKPKDAETKKQLIIRNNFKEGADMWSHILNEETKEKWREFAKVVMTDEFCMKSRVWIHGYLCWMAFWLKWGENGWVSYPDPPEKI